MDRINTPRPTAFDAGAVPPPPNSRGVIGAGHPTTQAALVNGAAPLLPYRAEQWDRVYGGALSARESGEPRTYFEVSKPAPPRSPRQLLSARHVEPTDARQWGARGGAHDLHFPPSAKRASWHALRPPEQRASRAVANLALGAGSMSVRARVHIHPAERNAVALFDPTTRSDAYAATVGGAATTLPPLIASERLEQHKQPQQQALPAASLASTAPPVAF